MKPEAETIAMSHALTPARQNEILSHWNWTPDGKVRVQCTNRTEALLRHAGIGQPRALEFYDVAVRRDKSGFLVIDHGIPQAASMGELFSPGGLLHGIGPVNDPDAAKAMTNEEAAACIQGMLAKIKATRTFELRVGPEQKLIVAITGYVDTSLPSPGEVEQWTPKRPNNTEVYAAGQALALHRSLESCEIHPETDAAA